MKFKRRNAQSAQTCRSISILIMLFVWLGQAAAGSLIATWDANTEDDLAGYKVFYGAESGMYTEETDVKKNTTFIAQDLKEGAEYFFVIKAYDYSGNLSAPSTEVNATVGGPALVALNEDESIRLLWTLVSTSDSYHIYRSTDPFFEPTTPIATVSATEHEFVDDQHFQNNEFETYYTVRALKDGAIIQDYNTVGAFDLELATGLNLISLPLVPADPTIGMVMSSQLLGGENSAEADQLRLWTGEEYEIAWLYDGPAAEYKGKWISATTGQEAKAVIDPNSSFWVAIQEGHEDTVLTITGSVPSEPERVISLEEGYNFIGSIYPVETLLDETELYDDAVMKGDVGSGNADILNAWTGDGYERAWVVDGANDDLDGTWMDETGKNETTISLCPGEGYIIWIKGDNPNKIWTFPNPALAE